MASSNISLFPRWFSTVLLILTLNIFRTMSVPIPDNDISYEDTQFKCKRREYYHNETQKCYKERTKGPCTGNMLFLKFDNNGFGDCDCSEDEVVPYVYNPQTNDCYATYAQSYCSTGEWLIFDETLNPICAPNSCVTHSTPKVDGDTVTVLFKNECVALNKPSKLCTSLQEVGIRNSEVTPDCISTIAEQSVVGTSQLKCRPGTRRDMNGKCRRAITISLTEEE
ncbi:uncharacterized protein LOC110859924 [Folsomia candida]|uniref:DUF4789 domain-containing protein n=1 Tax=Folsomia candida TaxID=158441 RepID=A0A226D7Z6_FOLCA|nr:uncharacterized protein LOC110859924 [Folsomia candida]OXA41675.1 hypothetical protein Fcan01_23423 [Folsomia candida]